MERNAGAGERERWGGEGEGIEKNLQPLQILSFLKYKSSEDKEQLMKNFQWQLRRAEERSRIFSACSSSSAKSFN